MENFIINMKNMLITYNVKIDKNSMIHSKLIDYIFMAFMIFQKIISIIMLCNYTWG